MNLRVDHVRLPNGVDIPEFHVIEYPDWACVICLTREGKVVLVEQYRHGIGRMGPELPAGAIGKNEEPVDAAQRELVEETGYTSSAWQFIGKCAAEPSKHTNYAHVFVARGAERVAEPQLDSSEDISVRTVAVSELIEMANAGTIVHGIHLAAIFWALHRGLLDRDQGR